MEVINEEAGMTAHTIAHLNGIKDPKAVAKIRQQYIDDANAVVQSEHRSKTWVSETPVVRR